MREDYSDSKIKLCTIYGRSDGNLEYYINSYSDYSGSKTQVYPFASEQEAIKYAQDKVVAKFSERPTHDLIKNADELGVKLDAELVKAFYEKCKSEIQKQIENSEVQIQKYKDQISTFNT